MADAQQIIQDMAKYSQVKQPGIFVRAGEALKGAVQGIFTERDKTREVSDIAIKDAPDHFPAEVKTSIENIKKSPIWKKETLEKLNPDYAKHIEQFGALINTQIERESKIPGAKNIVNTKYKEWIEALSNYEKIVSEHSSYIAMSAQVPEASVEKQKEALGITTVSPDKAELLAAFEYMGIKITEKDGKYTYEQVDGGVPYRDNKGQTQYLRISPEAAKAFVENYLAEGAATKQEEENLRVETEILENMKENLKRGGINAPTPEDIKKQEKKVEEAKKALEAAKERTITPKGLFRYFIEQEVKAGTKKKNLDPQFITRAEAMFHPDSPQWGAFSLNRDLEHFQDDLALVGSLSLATGEMQEFMETHEGVPQYDDFLTSPAADKFKTIRVVTRMERDAIGMHKEIGHAVEMNDLAIENIIQKYRDKVQGLEEKARLYEKQGKPVPASVEKLIEETYKKIESLELFGDVIKKIKDNLPKLSNVPEELKTNDTLLVKTIAEKVKYENGLLTLTEDLTHNGKVWLSQAKFQKLYNSRVLEERGMNAKEVPDVLEAAGDIEFQDGLSFAQVLREDAIQHRTKAFIQNPPNVVAGWYEQFKEARKKDPQLTGHGFISAMTAGLAAKEPGTDLTQSVSGFTDLEAIADCFDLMAAKESKKNAKQEGYAESPNAAAKRERAGLAYYHIDKVAQAIAADPELREEYDSASPSDKRKIFGKVHARLQSEHALDHPSKEELNDAGARWRHYSLFLDGNALLMDLEKSPDFDITKKSNFDLARVVTDVMEQDSHNWDSFSRYFEDNGMTHVNYETRTMDVGELEAESDAPLKKLKEIYPREIPAFKIAKTLQPYNIKAGQKFLDQIIDAFNDLLVRDTSQAIHGGTPQTMGYNASIASNPAKHSGNNPTVNASTNSTIDTTTNSGSSNNTSTNTGATNDGNSGNGGTTNTGATNDGGTAGQATNDKENGLFENLDDSIIRHASAMSAVGSGVKYIIEELKVKDDPTAQGILDVMDYMNNLAVNEPIVSYNNLPIPLPDAMRNIMLDFVAGKDNNPDGSPMTAEQQQVANLNRAKQNIEVLKGQVGGLKPGMPGAENIAKYTAMLDSFAYAFTSGLLTPAEVLKLIGMTSTSTMQAQNESGVIEISPGADLTPEQVATLKTCKTQEEFDKKVKEFGLYKENIVKEVYGVKQEAQSSNEAGIDASENLP